MLAVLNKYKILFIIISFLLLAVLLWMVFFSQERDGIPSRGVFVLGMPGRGAMLR